MYRRPKFLEVLHGIREEMSREADYDVDLFAEKLRNPHPREKTRRKNKASLPVKEAAKKVKIVAGKVD
jgi:hypothetical protein